MRQFKNNLLLLTLFSFILSLVYCDITSNKSSDQIDLENKNETPENQEEQLNNGSSSNFDDTKIPGTGKKYKIVNLGPGRSGYLFIDVQPGNTYTVEVDVNSLTGNGLKFKCGTNKHQMLPFGFQVNEGAGKVTFTTTRNITSKGKLFIHINNEGIIASTFSIKILIQSMPDIAE